MITSAISTLKARNGSSRQAVIKWVQENYDIKNSAFRTMVNTAIRKGVEAGKFAQPKGPSGPIKLVKATKEEAPKVAKKPRAASMSKVTKPKVAPPAKGTSRRASTGKIKNISKKLEAANAKKVKKPVAKTTKPATKAAAKPATKAAAKPTAKPAAKAKAGPKAKATPKTAPKSAPKAAPKTTKSKVAAKASTKLNAKVAKPTGKTAPKTKTSRAKR